MNILGKKIRSLRREQKLTQHQLAAKLQLIGHDISRSTLAKIESRNRQIIDIEIKMLALALQVSESELFKE